MRVIVVGVDDTGLSGVLAELPCVTVEQPGRGVTFYEVWETTGDGTSGQAISDAGASSHHPVRGGTKLRLVELHPDRTRVGDPAAELEAYGGHSSPDWSDRSFHRNATVDYNIVIAGEMYAKTELDERLVRAGDVVVQRGTRHTWSNRAEQGCVYASVMVSAEPLGTEDDGGGDQ